MNKERVGSNGCETVSTLSEAKGEKEFYRSATTSLKSFVIHDLPRIRTAKGTNEEITFLLTFNRKTSDTAAGES